MGAPEPCPRCGAAGAGVPARIGPLDALYHEVARIREIAERQEAEQETIAGLTREVQMLRETVARLRGTTHPAAARPQRVRSPAA
jgi:hypothetical protein